LPPRLLQTPLVLLAACPRPGRLGLRPPRAPDGSGSSRAAIRPASSISAQACTAAAGRSMVLSAIALHLFGRTEAAYRASPPTRTELWVPPLENEGQAGIRRGAVRARSAIACYPSARLPPGQVMGPVLVGGLLAFVSTNSGHLTGGGQMARN